MPELDARRVAPDRRLHGVVRAGERIEHVSPSGGSDRAHFDELRMNLPW